MFVVLHTAGGEKKYFTRSKNFLLSLQYTLQYEHLVKCIAAVSLCNFVYWFYITHIVLLPFPWFSICLAYLILIFFACFLNAQKSFITTLHSLISSCSHFVDGQNTLKVHTVQQWNPSFWINGHIWPFENLLWSDSH